MENNQWDDQFRELLGDYKPSDTSTPLDSSTAPTDSSTSPELTSEPDQIQAWKRIEASLNAADHAFDETVRHKVRHYGPTYDPHSWPVFLQRLTDRRHLRTKLIVLKSVEVAVLLLLILTAVNMGRMGKLPFESTLFKASQESSQDRYQPEIIPSEKNNPQHQTAPGKTTFNPDFTQARANKTKSISSHAPTYADAGQSQSKLQLNESPSSQTHSSYESISTSPALITLELNGALASHEIHTADPLSTTAEIPTLGPKDLIYHTDPVNIPELNPDYLSYTTDPIAGVDVLLDSKAFKVVPGPKFIKALSHTYTEFGILTQADYNALRMPEDRLYTSGRQITFPSKGITSGGFGVGFTVAIGHPIWALETGVVYSAKDFEPGRQAIVGGAFDNGSVEFEAMKLQLVSVPVQYRYRFDHKGRIKTYAIAGGGFHVIAQSDIDVQIKYHFASLAFGQNPNTNPDLAETILETRRIREHIRDGAPFSTKSFVSANAGLGIEYMLTEHKVLFLQSMIQYQIPNIEFSNNNGKHLRSVSLQAGVRGPLGK